MNIAVYIFCVLFLAVMSHALERKTMKCNGSEYLCGFKYNEVTYASSHNAQSSKKNWALFFLPSNINNQDQDILHQLENGIRAMKMPVHFRENDAYVCHGMSPDLRSEIQDSLCSPLEALQPPCAYFLQQMDPCIVDPATQSLASALNEVKIFLDHWRGEVVTLFLEDSTHDFNLLKKSFHRAGLDSYVYFHNKDQDWPTLRELIRSNRRLIVFLNLKLDSKKREISKYRYWNYTYDYAWSSAYHFESTEELKNDYPSEADLIWSSKIKRSSGPQNQLLILQHFVTPALAGNPLAAQDVNHALVLRARIKRYQDQLGIKPNFIWVDFYQLPVNQPGIFNVVNELNSRR
jgi:hypothetical protein